MPPPREEEREIERERDSWLACRREEAKVKTAEAVSDQVLPRFQTDTALPRKKFLAIASALYRSPMVVITCTESTIYTLNALKIQ